MSHMEHQTKRDRSTKSRRRVLAILAGGLVLGVGATVTLAAWNDSEFATGTFTAGTFNLQGTPDNSTWSDHASIGGAAALEFTVNPVNLSPGDVVYSPFAVRLAANTTSGANVAISVNQTTGDVTNLTYELIQPTEWGCSASTTGTEMVPASTALSGVGSGPAAFTLAAGSPTTAAGDPVYLCFKVTAGAGLVQNQSGTVTWEFAATSS